MNQNSNIQPNEREHSESSLVRKINMHWHTHRSILFVYSLVRFFFTNVFSDLIIGTSQAALTARHVKEGSHVQAQ